MSSRPPFPLYNSPIEHLGRMKTYKDMQCRILYPQGFSCDVKVN
jgi:hypothetical protein